MNKEIIRYSITLFIITFVIAFVLSGVNYLTKDRIANTILQEQTEAKKLVINGVDYDGINDLTISDNDPIVTGAWVAVKEAVPVAYIVNVKPGGYGGPIDMMVGLNQNLQVIDTKIISHTETAGLGSKATSPEFSSQLKGKSKDLTVKKNGTPDKNDVIAISGATITTNAVTKGVKAAIEEISTITKPQELSPPPSPEPSLEPTPSQAPEEGGTDNE